jgi:hypothetical protein
MTDIIVHDSVLAEIIFGGCHRSAEDAYSSMAPFHIHTCKHKTGQNTTSHPVQTQNFIGVKRKKRTLPYTQTTPHKHYIQAAVKANPLMKFTGELKLSALTEHRD